nr:MAG TPA: Protein phosphatase 1 regulatory subunit KINSASE G - I [Caudoviricetes sp.]
MNTQDKIINDLAIQLANKTIECSNYKALYEEALAELQQVKNERDEALADLKNIKLGFEGMNKILQSDERLKNLYEEVKAKQTETEEQ